MLSIKPKASHRFRVSFDDFGDQYHEFTVMRITRPHMTKVYGVAEFAPMEIDLWDDVKDMARTTVVMQLVQQMANDATFTVLIETVDQLEKVLEQWRLTQCSIIECRFDELTLTESHNLMIHLVVNAQCIEVNANGQMLTVKSDS